MNGKLKEFLLKIITITVALILILFFTNLWIIKPLINIKTIYKNDFKSDIKSYTFKEKENIKIDWKDANKYVGKYVITEGLIVSSYNNGKVCYLNFHKDYKNYLSLIIFSSAFKKFPLNPEKYYLGKKVRAEGRIKVYNERLEIILESSDQIKVMQ